MRTTFPLMLALVGCHAGQPKHEPSETLSQFIRQLEAYPKPPDALLDQVELKLQAIPCIGNLSRWKRLYTYGLPTRKVDESQIDFKLMLAGRLGIKSGRQTDFPGSTRSIDDTPIKMAMGSFNRKTGKVTLEFCASNFPGADER
ncbi:hypothetical protein [Sphingomonas sp. MMS24-J13]|uniref:hypothetical protein n=1 Tax=Sphingomonas sp. MMS24-J13 TaxID=3238686 RepID=UPI00384FBA80